MMKQLFSFVFAGIIGGLIVLGGLHLFENANSETTPTAHFTNITDLTPKIEKEFPFDFKEAAKIATPAVVHIAGQQTSTAKGRQRPNNGDGSNDPFDFFFSNPFEDYFGPKQGTGSGVIYSSDGYIITNNHVIDFADDITVTLNDNRQFKATVIGTYLK
ncbi:MAG: trypsin-like peptidase domain-containing protein, partial [Bacteroidota bacterium]